MATLDVFKNSIVGLKGVYGYMFPLQDKLITEEEVSGESQFNWFMDELWSLMWFAGGNQYEWNISDKPALEAFTKYFRNSD